MIVLYIILGIIGFVICHIILVVFFPVLKSPEQPLDRIPASTGGNPDCRLHVEYAVNGEVIRSWLYLPPDVTSKVPCIILCHGFGGTKDVILEQYALGFTNEGFAALALEYRHFGESDGVPRQHYSFKDQLEDIRVTVDYLRSREEINPEKIFIWGTSAGAPHGIHIAASDHSIAGVIAQCGGFDHQKDSKIVTRREGYGYILRLFVHGQRDKGRGRFGLSEHTIPIVGKPGTIAMLNAPGAYEGYSSLVPEGSLFQNKVCIRVMLIPPGVDPIKSSLDVRCPVLFCVCEHDNLVAPDSHVRVVENLGDKATVKKYPIGHFDIYKGEHFEKAFRDQVGFVKGLL
jgi:cephalosporin-C deacetylase-like acetyl esterase